MPDLSPSASRMAWPSTIATSSTGVVGVDVGVARAPHREVGERVLRERVRRWSKNGTVVSMWPATRAVEVELELDRRLARRTAQRCVRCCGGS
jgi:hypothetical protein